MKKLLSIFLVLICLTSIFAVDIGANIRVAVGVNEKGMNIKAGSLGISLNGEGDKAGSNSYIDYVIKPENNWHGFGIHVDCWNKPIDTFKFTAGVQTFINIRNPEDSDYLVFVRPEYTSKDKNYFYAEFGYSAPNSDWSKKTYYAYSEVDFLKDKDEFNVANAAALINFSFEGGKFYLKKLNAELAYIPFYNEWGKKGTNVEGHYSRYGKEYGVPSMSGMNREWLGCSEAWYYVDSEYLFGTAYANYKVEQRKLAVRYKYDVEAAKEDNGVFLFAEARNHTLSIENPESPDDVNRSFTGVLELGLYSLNAEVGLFNVSKNEKNNPVEIMGNVNFDIHRKDKKFDFNLSYAGIKAKNSAKTTFGEDNIFSEVEYLNGYMKLEYFNSADRLERDNGLFFTAFADTNVGGAAMQPSFRIGVNNFKNFKPVFDFNLYGGIYL